MRNPHRLLFSIALLWVIGVALFSSCKKDKDCELTITVLDGNTNDPIEGAEVWVHPNQAAGNLQIQDQKGTTDIEGLVTFTFKLPAILQADVTPPSQYTVPPAKLVKLEEGKSVSYEIKCY